MSTQRLDRINALARKSREVGLTQEEAAEQKKLRSEYIAEFRKNVVAQLDNVYFVDDNGNEEKLKKK